MKKTIMNYLCLLFMLVIGCPIHATEQLAPFAQNQQDVIQVKGVVKDDKGETLPGVSVTVVGTTNATMTDIDGAYTITVPNPNAQLRFTFLGFDTQTIIIGSRTTIDVLLVERASALDEVVVIGYGAIKKSNITGSVSSISAKDLQANIAQSTAGALQGRVAGVEVKGAGGAPGTGMSINIRGIGSINNSNDPLYLIDGVYGDINMVDPSDIVSLEILKDGSAAAIYGSRAANGVVLITTKGGRKNTPLKVDVNIYGGIQNITKKLDVMNADQWVNFMKKNYEPWLANPSEVPASVANWNGGSGTNWQDEGFRTASILKTNANLSGGSTNSTYSVSAGYMNQEGIMLNSGYDAINVRTKNLFYLLNDHVRIGTTFMMKSWKQKKNKSVITDYLRQNPIIPVYDDKNVGGYGAYESWMQNMDNPVGVSNMFIDRTKGTDIFLNAFAEVDLFIEGLKYKMNVGYTKNNSNVYSRNPSYNFGGGTVESFIGQSSINGTQWLLENTLNYDRTFGKHTVSGLLGYSAQKNTLDEFGASRKNIPDGVSSINGAPNNVMKNEGTINVNTMASMFARVIYSYDSRYMISASIRRDGSSRFAEGHRYGNFPSVSVGWNIMNEGFFSGLKNAVDELKVRASYGVLGNQEISNYTTQNTVTNGLNYVLQGGGLWAGAIPGANWVSFPNLTWEETKTSDIGIDSRFLNGKLTVSADYYVKNTNNILLQVNMPPSAGLVGSPYMNAGQIQNKGFEFSIDYKGNIDDFTYNVGFNISTVKNKVNKITATGVQEISGWKSHEESAINWAIVGQPIGSFYLVKTDGIFQSQAEVLAHKDKNGNLIQPNANPGDIRFLDYDGDGKIDYNDRQRVGDPFPDFTYGIRLGAAYKGFDLNVFFDGSQGNDIYNYTRARMESTNKMTNFSTSVLDSWTSSNPSGMPRFTSSDPNNNGLRVSDRWLEDGSFFRLKTLELGYTLSKKTVSQLKLGSVRFYTAMENLFTITKYTGYTPDLGLSSGQNGGGSGIFTMGVDYGRYPQSRIMSLGLQVGF